MAILHFIPDEFAYKAVAELKAAMPPGSYLAITHATGDNIPAEITGQVQVLYEQTNAPAVPRTREQILRFFDGLDLMPPGLASVGDWAAMDTETEPARAIFLAGVGRKS
jgi:hypothetical protein